MASATPAPVSGPQLDNRRVLAALIDLAIVGVGAALILAAAGVLGESPSEIGAPLIAVTLGWALYYYFACESSDSAQTVGKRVMKLRVVRADGSPTDMRDVALRTVLRLVDMQFAYLVGLIVMLATGERRGRVGDLAAGTKIVSADAPATPPVAEAPAAEAAAPRVPIAESGPAFEPVAEEEPEPVEDDAVDLASPSLKELAVDVEATAGSAPDGEEGVEAEGAEAGAVEADAEEDIVDEDPLAGDEDDDEPLAAEAEPVADGGGDSEDEIKRIETISAIDLVMEDSQRKS